jgi:hypothetical protein
MDLSSNSEPGSSRPFLRRCPEGAVGLFGNAWEGRKTSPELFHRCSSPAAGGREARPGLR